MSSHLAHYLPFLLLLIFFLTYYHCIPFLMSFTSTIHYVVLLISNKNLPLKKNYAAPVRSTNLRDTNYRNIQYTQNEALRIATGCHKMSSVDHLHVEAKMLKVREHSELLSAQYLARCLEPGNVCHPITTRETPKRRMKETLFTRHRNTVELMMLANNRKATLQAIHSDAVNKAVKDQKNNIVLDGLPHPINDSEKYLTRKERATLAQLRSEYC